MKISSKIKEVYFQFRESSTINRILKVYWGDIVSKFMAAISAIILIRSLSQQDYALYIAFSAVANLFLSFIGVGINGALIRFSAEYISKTGQKPIQLYVASLLAQISLLIITSSLIFLFPLHASKLFFGKSELSYILLVSTVFGLGNILLFWGQGVLKAEERFNDFIKTLWIKQLAIILLVVVLLSLKLINFIWVAWSISILQLIIGFGVVFYCFKSDNNQIVKPNSIRHESSLFIFFKASSWLIGYGVAIAIFSQMDKLMLTRFASSIEVANYGVAFQYYSMAILLLGSISAVLVPKFSKLEMQNPFAQKEFLINWTKILVWLILPIGLLVIIFKPLYILINGSQYSDSYSVFSILAIGVWLSLLLSPLTNILMSRKEFRYLFILSTITLILSIPIFYFGVTLLGGIGTALAVIVVHNVILQLPILWKVIKQ